MTLLFLLWMGGCQLAFAQDYQEQADRFLKKMPAGLQDRQCAAIQQALEGELLPLQQVRKGRNTLTPVPETVQATEVTPTLRLYQPKERKNEVLPLLVYLHGGGWTIGSIHSCARYCGELAATGEVMVLAVEYRLAPEYPYPCGLTDCVEAVEYARAHAKEWGSDPSLVSVGGDSSGGNLALATALRLQQEQKAVPHSLVLYYPVVSSWNDQSESWKKYARGAALDAPLMDAFNRAYCEGVKGALQEDAHQNALISPSVATDEALSKLPKILLIAAERDILHDQGQQFAERLQTLGVAVERRVLPGSVHLFVTVVGQEKAFREAVHSAEGFLKLPRP